MISEASVRSDFCLPQRDIVLIDDAMVVGIDVGVVRYTGVVVYNYLSPVIDKCVAVKDHVITYVKVVTEGKFHPMEDLDIFSTPFEDVAS
tara:strand:+ start:273 stop:542 length:270 start_codon:yes stop_codon:yes gene_type:complete